MDNIKEAQHLLTQWDEECTQRAAVHALIAIAEQLRIANAATYGIGSEPIEVKTETATQPTIPFVDDMRF